MKYTHQKHLTIPCLLLAAGVLTACSDGSVGAAPAVDVRAANPFKLDAAFNDAAAEARRFPQQQAPQLVPQALPGRLPANQHPSTGRPTQPALETPVLLPLDERPTLGRPTDAPDNNKPGNDRPGGNKPGDNRPVDDKPDNAKPDPEKPNGEKPDGERPGGNNEPPSNGATIFSASCPVDLDDTVAEITAPGPYASVNAGTELRWDRTGHDICGAFGSNKRYAISVCASPAGFNCNPANGFYRANVSPDDLGWDADTQGSFTLSAEDIDTVREKANVNFGDTVYFNIRYNYDIGSTYYGQWVSRPLQLAEANAVPVSAPVGTLVLGVPGTYSTSPPFSLDWNPVSNAEFYTVRLQYRQGSPSGTDMGVFLAWGETRDVAAPMITSNVNAPAYTQMLVWGVKACNAAGCGPESFQAGLMTSMVSPNASPSFDTIKQAFKAPSCVNCHAVAATSFEAASVAGYESGSNFGLPPGHPPGNSNCTACHTANLTPGGSHAVPWQAAPATMDLRGKSDAELCEMARDPGSLAESIADHLLGDPLIIWAVEGGQLPEGKGPTDSAFPGGLAAWETAVLDWVEGGASCD